MPGGIDMHCHIAGPKVNAARRMRTERADGKELGGDRDAEGAGGGVTRDDRPGHEPGS